MENRRIRKGKIIFIHLLILVLGIISALPQKMRRYLGHFDIKPDLLNFDVLLSNLLILANEYLRHS